LLCRKKQEPRPSSEARTGTQGIGNRGFDPCHRARCEGFDAACGYIGDDEHSPTASSRFPVIKHIRRIEADPHGNGEWIAADWLGFRDGAPMLAARWRLMASTPWTEGPEITPERAKLLADLLTSSLTREVRE